MEEKLTTTTVSQEQLQPKIFKIDISELANVAGTLKKTQTVERYTVPLQFQLTNARKNLQKPKVNVVQIIQPEFLLCKQMLRKTTTRSPEHVFIVPSPLFLEMMEKYKSRQERLKLKDENIL